MTDLSDFTCGWPISPTGIGTRCGATGTAGYSVDVYDGGPASRLSGFLVLCPEHDPNNQESR